MIIGITGHQDIGDAETVEWARKAISKEIDKQKPSHGISCLAKGADQLFAELIIRNEIDLVAVIPSLDYESTFQNPEDLNRFIRLKSKAREIRKFDFQKATEEAFYEASKFLVDSSDIVIAIWNSKPSKGFGGTADVVSYVLEKRKKLIHINPITKTIKYY